MKDKEMMRLIAKETTRQIGVVNLIASENYVSDDVRSALGSVFGNKYADGYPGHRYYGGNEVVDEVELLCQARALDVFGVTRNDWGVNVQALSGTPANLAVYSALVPQGGKIMGMSLMHGGHLSHGHTVSMTGKFWQQVSYGVNHGTEVLDYEEIRNIAIREKPHILVAGFTAYSRVVDWAMFRSIADEVGALLLVDLSHVAGLVAGGVYPSPFPFADVVTTTTHKTLRGPRGALIFSRRDAREIPERIDRAVFPGLQGGPHVNQISAIAVALREASTLAFSKYARMVISNTSTIADELMMRGWRVVSGGTDSHLFLLDTGLRGLSGNVASRALEQEGIIVNKNTIPFDTRTAFDPSGIRIGAAAETTRGAKSEDMLEIASLIDHILTEAMASGKR